LARLTKTAKLCALQDGCPVVHVKHVDHAENVLRLMVPSERALGRNPKLWWLLASLFFASALAIPDAGAMLFGNPDKSWLWFFLKVAFFILFACGALSALAAYLITLGPHQPRWFLNLKEFLHMGSGAE
jgi:hypothetical protein